ncbi:hypothetical protein ACFY2Q_29460 [Micromonospora sp. NPDC000316]|uniref:hypothetical protein n=1 Tax=Micromonospora sp. NPDC000316 TaxID=3364216 RepID=UPI0036A6E086
MVKNQHVTVTVDPGTVTEDAHLTVVLGAPLGTVTGPYAKETWGAPVQVDHAAPLAKPVTLTWDVAKLTASERATLALVRWNPDLAAWAPAGDPVNVTDTTLTAQVTQFSIIDWVSNGAAGIGQTVGQWLGKRADAPKCSGERLPPWVRSVVRPDEDLSAAALRTCVEPDSKSGVVTIRVANNRSYGQRITLKPEGIEWPWVWPGEADVSPRGWAWTAARAVFDSKSSALIPETRTTAFGVARPATPGPAQITMTAQATTVTIFMDIVGMVVDNLTISGSGSPVIDAFLQGLYACGGKQLLGSRPDSADEAATMALKTAVDCVNAVLEPGTDAKALSFGVVNAYENALRAEIAKGGAAAENAVKAGRLTHEIARRLKYLQLFEITEYVSNQLADSLVGPTSITLHLTGAPQDLGAWTPTCMDAAKDANLLYRNLALQDRFADKSKELWQFSTWAADAKTAAKPLGKCTAAQQDAVANAVDRSWADKKAGAVVSQAVRELTPGTRIVTVDPWTDGTAPSATTRRAGSGSSCIPSEVAPRPEGFRCFTDSAVIDPCFANPHSVTEYLCAPWGMTEAWTLLKGVTRDSAFVNDGKPAIFVLRLTNGAVCRRSTGSGPAGVPGYPYWVGSCTGGPYGSQSKVWRIGENMSSAPNYPLYATNDPKVFAAAVETSDGTVQRLPVATAWR